MDLFSVAQDTPSARTEAEQRIDSLREAIRKANHEYYVLDQPTLTDAEYDRLFRELQALEAEYPDLSSPDSPTQRVGADIESSHLGKVEHRFPMLSLDNAFDEAELEEHFRRECTLAGIPTCAPFFASPKYDGLAGTLTYQRGVLVRAATRGTGTVGEDITLNAKTVRGVPHRIDDKTGMLPEWLEVRGEFIMRRSGLEAANQERVAEGKEPFANVRNAAAGSMRVKDSSVTARRPMGFFAYGAIFGNGEGAPVKTQSEMIDLLVSWGFQAAEQRGSFESMSQVHEFVNQLEAQRAELDFAIDGVVIMSDRLEVQRQLGLATRTPRYAFARKWESEVGKSRVVAVHWQVGRTRVLTPKVEIEPVQVMGTVIRYATLHNEDRIQELDLHVGDTVLVRRAGDVIPEIIGVDVDARKGTEVRVEIPHRCPGCDAPTERDPGGAFRRCTGNNCVAQTLRQLEHFASRAAMDIRSLGERTIAQLVEAGLVHDPADLYDLQVEQVLSLEGFATKSATQLIEAIQGSKSVPFERVMFALGIPGIGESAARTLARGFGEIDRVLQASEAQMTELEDFGPKTARAVLDWLEDERNQTLITRLRSAGLLMKTEETLAPKEGPLLGKTFVVTGTLPTLSRKQATDLIEQAGGKVTGSVTKNTDFLVVGEDAGSKLDKAKKLGIPLWSEEDLLRAVK